MCMYDNSKGMIHAILIVLINMWLEILHTNENK